MAENPPQVYEGAQPSPSKASSGKLRLSEGELDRAIKILRQLIAGEADP